VRSSHNQVSERFELGSLLLLALSQGDLQFARHESANRAGPILVDLGTGPDRSI
jgi:hypothetical protein